MPTIRWDSDDSSADERGVQRDDGAIQQGYSYGSKHPLNDYENIFIDESFEHNDLSGNYTGNTGVATIQNSTVFDGSYAIHANNLTRSSNLIVRTTGNQWVRDNTKISYQYRHDSSGTAYGGGVAFATEKTNMSNFTGYHVWDVNNNGVIRIEKYESGSRSYYNSTSHQTSTGSWIEAEVYFEGDKITLEIGGSTVSLTDSDFKLGYLGFHFYDPIYIDNVRFLEINT